MARSSVDGQPIWAVLVCNRIELRYPHGHAVVARKYETYVRINSAILKASSAGRQLLVRQPLLTDICISCCILSVNYPRANSIYKINAIKLTARLFKFPS